VYGIVKALVMSLWSCQLHNISTLTTHFTFHHTSIQN